MDSQENLLTIIWDGETVKAVPFNRPKLMLFTTVFYLLGGCMTWLDGLLTMYYHKNPNLYSHYLCDQNGVLDFMIEFGWGVPVADPTNATLTQLITNITFFEENYNLNNCDYIAIYNYIHYHRNLCDSKVNRFFINTLTFGLFQILAALFAFNARRPHHNWKKDVLVLNVAESLSSVSVIANVCIWVFMTYGSDFHYFIFFPNHYMIHFVTLGVNFVNIFIKIYLFTFTFNDYFTAVPMFKPIIKAKQ